MDRSCRNIWSDPVEKLALVRGLNATRLVLLEEDAIERDAF
jgi:hypothetical protein